MHALVALDEQREPLTSLITWADARSADEARGLRASDLATDLYRTSGTPIHPMTPLTKIMWYSRREPVLRLTGALVGGPEGLRPGHA